MQIEHPTPPPRLVVDWEVFYRDGGAETISIDEKAGDTVIYNPETCPVAYFHLSEKTVTRFDGTEAVLPAEDIDVFLANVLRIQRHVRTVEGPSFEQKEMWINRLKELSAEIH